MSRDNECPGRDLNPHATSVAGGFETDAGRSKGEGAATTSAPALSQEVAGSVHVRPLPSTGAATAGATSATPAPTGTAPQAPAQDVVALLAWLDACEAGGAVTYYTSDAGLHMADPAPEGAAATLRALVAECGRLRADAERLDWLEEAQPESEWHEDDGPVLWWSDTPEPPYVGTPLDFDWPGYHTHWTPIVAPSRRSEP